MKQDKATLTYLGQSLLRHQFDLLEGLVGVGQVIVSGDRPDFPHVKDRASEMGPVEGIRSVIRYLVDSRNPAPIVLIPVDMPFLTEEGLRRLMSAKTSKVVTKFEGEQLPMVIHDGGGFLKAIESATASSDIGKMGGRSFGEILRRLPVDEIKPEPAPFFLNINTPEDWNAAIS